MKMIQFKLSLVALGIAGACSASAPVEGDNGSDAGASGNGTNSAGGGNASSDEWDAALTQRQRDYGAALRIAALRLTGDLPTLSEIRTVTKGDEAAQKAAYEGLVRQYIDRPTFVRQALAFWRDTFRMGEGALDTAPTFATQLTVENRSYLELLTATAGNCPTLNGTTFTAGNCNSGAPANAGVFTDPAVMRQFYSNMAFRRTRWVQETFACTKFPIEAPIGAAPATAANAAAMVNLFNSVASRAGGMLSDTKNAGVYKSHYDALIGLNRAASRTTTAAGYKTSKSAAQLLGTNLGARLAITADDLTRYGIGGNMRPGVANLGRVLITAVKAFKMGLTNNITIPALGNEGDATTDPHNAFGTQDYNVVPPQLKRVLDGFMADLRATSDDVTGRSLDNDTVVTFHGDFPKDPYNAGGNWTDNTPRNANWTWIYSAGHLKSGWFGGASGGSIDGYDAAGNTKQGTYNGADTARYANAAIAYAVAKRDAQAISSFVGNVTVSGTFGVPKDV